MKLNPTRLLLAGDTHHDTDWVCHLATLARQEACSLIVQVGDFGYFPNQDYGRAFLSAVTGALVAHDLTLVFIDGNHDDHDALAALPRDADGFAPVNERILYAPRTLRWSWSGVSFAAAGGAVSVDAASRVEGENWWRTETLSYAEVNSLIDDGEVDVLLAHDAPAEAAIADFAKADLKSEGHRRGVSALMEALNPRLLVHGHYHHNHDSEIVHAGGTTRVLGLGMNQRPENDRGDGYTVLALPELTLT